MSFPPTMEDLGDDDDDNEFLRNPCEEEEEELQFDDPEGEEEVIEDDEEEGGDNDGEVQVVTQSGPRANRPIPEGPIAFDPAIHDITGYEKADIIKLRNKAFKGDVRYTKKVKGSLIGLPFGQIPIIRQINSTELFTLYAPLVGKSENNDEDKEGASKGSQHSSPMVTLLPREWDLIKYSSCSVPASWRLAQSVHCTRVAGSLLHGSDCMEVS